MARFVFAYRAPKDYTPEVFDDGAGAGSVETKAAWTAWFESMSAQLQDYGNPVFDRRTVGDTGPDTVLGGYSMIIADDFESAMTLAKGCPLVGAGGGVEVGELTKLERGSV